MFPILLLAADYLEILCLNWVVSICLPVEHAENI